MNESVLAPALLCATLGLMLSFGGSRQAVATGIVVMLIAAFGAAALPIGSGYANMSVAGCWIGVIAAAAFMHLPWLLGHGTVAALSLIAGTWAGLTVASSGAPPAIVSAGLWVLTALPGAWLVAQKRGIFVKVAGSWLAAAALLSLGLGMVSTLGNEPDHRE